MGRCKQLNMSRVTGDQSGSYVLIITLAYNDSDRTYGKLHSLRDFSIYFDNQDIGF